MPPRPIAILGAGNAATALALVLARHGAPVRLWTIEPDVADDVNRNHRNAKYLSGVGLPANISAHGDIGPTLAGAQIVICAVPSHAIVETLRAASGHLAEDAVVASITKGIDETTLAPISVQAAEALPEAIRHRLCVVAGPAVANEIAQGHPAAMVVASADADTARLVADALSGTHIKAATSTDISGAGYAMALKNAYAIALGMCDGLKFPMNTKALIITLALEEMARILAAAGAEPQTATSLAGLGDLLVTGLSPHGRNRTYGERLVGATTKDPAQLGLGTVEGIAATAAALRLRAKLGVDAPLLETVGKCLAQESGYAHPFVSLIHELRLD
jgi:glycerol-3-phosphate dehydrogenase (NAD(P)+)